MLKVRNDLAKIVRINEQIKVVVNLARAINLLALNAIIVSRRAGDVAQSFGVISNELRGFSKELTETMNSLRQISYSTVGVASNYQRYKHINYLLVQTSRKVTPGLMSRQLQASDKRIQQLHQRLADSYQELSEFLDEADKSGRFGTVIARFLKIEAAYGGEFSQTLMQVAQQFDQYIESIPNLIGQLTHLLKRD